MARQPVAPAPAVVDDVVDEGALDVVVDVLVDAVVVAEDVVAVGTVVVAVGEGVAVCVWPGQRWCLEPDHSLCW